MMVRRKTRLAGVSSRTATLMSRYGIPQITDSAMNSSQARRLTASDLRAKRARDDVGRGGEMQTIPPAGGRG